MVWLLYIFLGLVIPIVLFLLTYVLAALILPLIGTNKYKKNTIPNRKLYLHGSGVHIDIIFQKADLPEAFLQELGVRPTAKFIAFGWGDRGFYLDTPTWAELKFTTAFKAMMLKSPTVMHLTEYQELGKEWRLVNVEDQQLNTLLEHVKSGFRTSENGQLIAIPDRGYTEDDWFFEGSGTYHCIKTCNTWINSGLRKAGLKTGVWATQQNGILRYYPETAVE